MLSRKWERYFSSQMVWSYSYISQGRLGGVHFLRLSRRSSSLESGLQGSEEGIVGGKDEKNSLSEDDCQERARQSL